MKKRDSLFWHSLFFTRVTICFAIQLYLASQFMVVFVCLEMVCRSNRSTTETIVQPLEQSFYRRNNRLENQWSKSSTFDSLTFAKSFWVVMLFVLSLNLLKIPFQFWVCWLKLLRQRILVGQVSILASVGILGREREPIVGKLGCHGNFDTGFKRNISLKVPCAGVLNFFKTAIVC